MNKPEFLAQYNKLRRKFPYSSTLGIGNENCDYADNIFNSSNCYYVFESAEMHNCLYCEDGFKQETDIDCRIGLNSSFNCECLDYVDSSNCYYSQSFARCYDCHYCWYCVDCHDCFGCANINNKSFCIFNIQHTEEEYRKLLPELMAMPKNEVLKRRKEIINKLPQLHSEHVENVNSEYCDYAYYCTNCYYCFDCAHDQDCGYLLSSYECKDSWDCNYLIRGELCLECCHSGDLYNCYKVIDSARCFDSYFLEDCNDCHHCFGCVKLSNKSYCILNIQYTKEEYEQRLAEMKKTILGINNKIVDTI